MASVTEELICSICLEMYTEAVTLPCGHNFCRVCIDHFLDTQFGVYSCPDCRAHFPSRPALQRNITLCNVVTHFRSVQSGEPSGIFCTHCIRASVPAVRSCLHCEASLCADHLRVHSTASEHILTQPRASLHNRKCLAHKEVLKYFCAEDAVCICVSCRLDGEHRGHRVEKLEEAAEKKKENLRNIQQRLASDREEAERRIHRLWEQRRLIREPSASTAMADLIRQMELKKNDLSRRIGHIGELCEEADALTVLLDGELEAWREAEDDGVEDLYQGLISEDTVCEEEDIVLDVDTASNNLRVSSDRKTVTCAEAYQRRPETSVRFQYNQVLSAQRFSSGPHSWDVEVSEAADWRIGVAYQSVERRGERAYIGESSKSWCVRKLYNNQYSAIHDGNVTSAPHTFTANAFRICLDYDAGRISFYELSDPIHHLHTFTATFTEPLHAAFGIGYSLGNKDCWMRIVV